MMGSAPSNTWRKQVVASIDWLMSDLGRVGDVEEVHLHDGHDGWCQPGGQHGA